MVQTKKANMSCKKRDANRINLHRLKAAISIMYTFGNARQPKPTQPNAKQFKARQSKAKSA